MKSSLLAPSRVNKRSVHRKILTRCLKEQPSYLECQLFPTITDLDLRHNPVPDIACLLGTEDFSHDCSNEV